MNLTSCRDLKLEMLDQAYQMPDKKRHRRVYRARAAKVRRRHVVSEEPTPVAAFGVAPGEGKQYKLAVRVFQGHTARGNALIRRYERHLVRLVQHLQFQIVTHLTRS